MICQVMVSTSCKKEFCLDYYVTDELIPKTCVGMSPNVYVRPAGNIHLKPTNAAVHIIMGALRTKPIQAENSKRSVR